jgi:AraC family transcriptional activator of pobA
MKLFFRDLASAGELLLIEKEPGFDRLFFARDRAHKYLTIAWNTGEAQQVIIDEASYTFPSNTILPLVVNQSFRFERPEDIIAWQFNREFYCIVDHDKEVSCVGFLFYGSSTTMFIALDEKDQQQFELLYSMFKDEMQDNDGIQAAMLRSLLAGLIIRITRLAKKQYLPKALSEDAKTDTIRKFNLLVEMHFKEQHQVQFYAQSLNKSPKTLSNLFSIYNHKTPLQVIHERLILEAKRLFYYSDKSAKEIAAELGFEDAGHFSRFFKNLTNINPSDFRKTFQQIQGTAENKLEEKI